MSEDSELRFGSYCLIGRNGPLLRDAAEIKLQPKALAVLWTLARQAGEVVTKSALLDAVWPGVVVGDEALTFQVQTLRRALDDDPKAPRYIVTAHRVGFRFAMPVRTRATPSVELAAGTATFVGREEPLQILQGLFGKASQGIRQLVFVTGEAGIGKTTLVEAFLARLAAQAPQTLISRGQCLEQNGAGEAYLPVIEALDRLLRQTTDSGPLDLLRRVAPNWLLQLPALLEPADYAELKQQTAGARQERMLREMADAVEQLSAEQTLVMVLEDLHWSDTATLDLLAMLARRQEPARLLLVCTYRPVDAIINEHPVRSLQLDLKLKGRASELALGYLAPEAVQRYLEQRLGAAGTAPALAERVHARSAGHPLFLTQISDYLEPLDAAARAAAAALESTLPQGLRDLIELQLRRLGLTEQLVLETASVAGAEFAAASVATASGLPIEAVEQHCEQLIQQGQFLEDRGLSIWPDGTTSGRYRFRHVLYEQVLRERLAVSRRARLHRQIAERIEAAYGERAREVAGELANHFQSGGLAARAVHYCVHLARTALERHAPDEVRLQVERGLGLLDALPTKETKNQAELPLRLIAAAALQVELGYSTTAARPHLDRIKLLIKDCADPELLQSSLQTLWLSTHFAIHLEAAVGYADQILALGQQTAQPVLECCGYSWRSLTLHLLCRHREADDAAAQALRVAGPLVAAGRVNLEPFYSAKTSRAIIGWYLGHPDTALRFAREAVADAEAGGNPYTRSVIHSAALTFVLLLRRDWPALLAAADQAIALSQKYSHRDALAWATKSRAIAHCMLTRSPDSLPRLLEILAEQRAVGACLNMPLEYVHTAECWLLLGRLDEAHRALDLAFTVLHEHGLRSWEPEALRVFAELLMAEGQGQEATAESRLQQALTLARSREVRSLELRVATSLASLWQRQGRTGQALNLLQPVYDRFTEGFEAPDLLAARRLLGALAGAAPDQSPRRRKA